MGATRFVGDGMVGSAQDLRRSRIGYNTTVQGGHFQHVSGCLNIGYEAERLKSRWESG